MSEGTEDHDPWSELAIRLEDETVRKYRFSAFLLGTRDPAYWPRTRGFDTVPSTGTITHVCGKSSARDATTMNFHTAIPTGTNAGSMPEEQCGSRLSFHDICADVMDADFSIRRTEHRRRGQAVKPDQQKGRCARHGPRAEDRNRREYMHLAMGAVPELTFDRRNAQAGGSPVAR
jgi:hypothetical protein